jgi:hypothetical protein
MYVYPGTHEASHVVPCMCTLHLPDYMVYVHVCTRLIVLTLLTSYLRLAARLALAVL